ncbi:MAG: hypothetical protein JNM94_05810 [Phycisphaerae bacterium]|nr:hypothetical protein [Phycisphaerae bacterium]
MAIPRNRLFDPTKPVTAHCISRCVRRERLLGAKERRRALIERLTTLVAIFAIDVLEWAILMNHLHLVASTHPDLVDLWSDREVAERWRTLSPDHVWRRRNRVDRSLPAQPQEIDEALKDPALIARWRRGLADLSVFHKFLKQEIARMINVEDGVTGHCWEGRFKSIVALDEEAIVAHMVYVALNPVRAGMTETLDGYDFASITRRIDELKERIRAGEFRGEAEAAREKLRSTRLVPALPCNPGKEASKRPTLANGLPNPWLDGRVPPIGEGITLAAFLAETYAIGRVRRIDKRGAIPESVSSPLAELDSELAKAERWTSKAMSVVRDTVGAVEDAMSRGLEGPWGNFSGSAAALARKARETGRKFLVAIAACAPGSARRIAAGADVRSGLVPIAHANLSPNC